MNGVLPHQEIVNLVPTVILDGDQACIGTASYDMRIGDDYYLYDERCPDGKQIRKRGSGQIIIPPNGLLLCEMHESLKLPSDLVGHLSLKVTLLLKGLIMASQSQIDAGYEGKIFALLYNLSHRDVCLKDGELVLRLELVRLEQNTSKPYDNAAHKRPSLSQAIDAPLISTLMNIREEAHSAVEKVEAAKDKLSITQVVGAALLGIIGVVAGSHFASDSKVDQLTQTVTALQQRVAEFEAATPSRARLDELERQNKATQEKLNDIGESLRSKSPPIAHLPANTIAPAPRAQ